jgi:hypothetical protein
MATTICDFKSLFANVSHEAGKVVSSVPAPEPNDSATANSKSQASGELIPRVLAASLTRLVDIACELQSLTNGATVSLQDGNLTGRRLFAISIYPERSVALPAVPTWHNIFAFVSLNVDLIVKPCHAFGLWFDDAEGVHVLDVVICLPDRRTALELGQTFNQTSIFDLAARREIAVGTRRVRPASAHADATNLLEFLEGPDEAPCNRQTEATIR